MRNATLAALNRVVVGAAVLLILKVTLSVILGYRDYLPPNFNSDFLLGREAYFYGPYRWAFYAHLVSGPASLVAGTILISNQFRQRAPQWHGRLGRLQIANVLLILAPSGLWMAWYAATGAVAGAGLAALAMATAVCAAAGWRAAVVRQFGDHRRWMWRLYLLLCSAVVIRLVGGMAAVMNVNAEWIYPLSCWVSWLAPLMVFESMRLHIDAPEAPIVARS